MPVCSFRAVNSLTPCQPLPSCSSKLMGPNQEDNCGVDLGISGRMCHWGWYNFIYGS